MRRRKAKMNAKRPSDFAKRRETKLLEAGRELSWGMSQAEAEAGERAVLNSSDEEVLKAASSSDDDWKKENKKKKKKSSRTKRTKSLRKKTSPPNRSTNKAGEDETSSNNGSDEEGSSSSSSYNDDDEDDDTGSDFSEEEVAGRLSDATSESEDERKATKRLRQEAREEAARGRKGIVMGNVAGGGGRKGSAQTLEHKVTLVRSAATIDWDQRMKAALARAQQIIHHETGAGAAVGPAGGAAVQMLLASLKKPSRKRPRRPVLNGEAPGTGDHLGNSTTIGSVRASEGDVPSIYRSSRAFLDSTHSAESSDGSLVVITFPSGQLPPMFSS
ncbi:Hypothetical protein, putative [Bodo saltans]|uniref:Uncharacterized protein n=1 Tax=Bodo saltans TaxID=75058 RepID=A0A0S4IX70_BODSA|nr:Hypothetical protein, putative [Bodo saltans]|eukprot:CUG02788.1 Hypothetical protein, putative [Bodo saltans]